MKALVKRIVIILLVLSLVTSMAASLSSCSKNKKGEEVPGLAGPAGADGANGKDGLTPFIGENGNWWIGTIDTGVLASGTNGRDGADGKNGIDGKNGADAITPTFTYDAESGYLCISYGDDSEPVKLVNIGDIVADGKDGTSVSACEINADGELVIQYSDGRSENLGKIVAANGKDGKDGKDGNNGVDGVGISDVALDEAGNLTVTLSDGTVHELGNIKGADGKNGSNGTNGTNGVTPQLKIDTVSLEWYVSYDNGTTWKSLDIRAVGTDGANGSNGTNGTDGVTPRLKIDSDNQWQVSYDNGNTWQDLGAVATGAQGANGISPRLRITDGYWEVSYNNGTTWESLNVKAEGSDGANGAAGANGRGIEKMEIIDGYLYVTYTDSTTPVNIGKVGTESAGGDAPVSEPYTEGLEFYPMNGGTTYGVCIGKAIYMEHIVIPSTYNGKPVTVILEKGFTNSSGSNTYLKSIVIPSSIVEIGASAFEYCTEIENLVIPASVVTIGNYAFVGVKSVTFEISKSEIPEGQVWDANLGCPNLNWKE